MAETRSYIIKMIDIDGIFYNIGRRKERSASTQHVHDCRYDGKYAGEDDESHHDVIVEPEAEHYFLVDCQGQSSRLGVVPDPNYEFLGLPVRLDIENDVFISYDVAL